MTKKLLFSLIIPIFLSSCLSYRMISGGMPSTDLSWLKVGAKRDYVEENLGEPMQVGSTENGIIAVYEYDQGYTDIGTPGMEWTAPLILMYEIASMGALSSLEADARQCQKGLLRVMYDAEGKVLAAKECYGTADHTDCSSTHTSRRPSTLSNEFSIEQPEEVDCNFSRTYPHIHAANQSQLTTQIDHDVRTIIFADQSQEELLRKAQQGEKARKGEAETQLQFYYDTVGQDPIAAQRLLCKSADLGHPDARYRLAMLYEHGSEGVKVNYVMAYLWYALAGQAGKYWGGKDALRLRNTVLDSQQIAVVKILVHEWRPGHCEIELGLKSED